MICQHEHKVVPTNHTYSSFLISVFSTMEAPHVSTTLPTVAHVRMKRNGNDFHPLMVTGTGPAPCTDRQRREMVNFSRPGDDVT